MRQHRLKHQHKAHPLAKGEVPLKSRDVVKVFLVSLGHFDPYGEALLPNKFFNFPTTF